MSPRVLASSGEVKVRITAKAGTAKEANALIEPVAEEVRRRLGDEVFMLLTLMDDPNKLPVAGQVVWITPPNCQGNKAQGIGVQFSEDERGQAAKRRIESILGGVLQSTRSTHTY